MKVSAIIIHWNTPKELKVQISKLKITKNIEVILIDNFSTRENVSQLESYKLQGSGYKIIYNKSNLGFAKACNQGAKIAKGDWLLFLNPDTHIASQNVLRFVREAEALNYDAASLKPTSDNYSKPLPSALSLLVEFSPLRRLISLNFFKNKTLFGGGLLIKSNVLRKIGGWDEDFFLWFEDSDITTRLVNDGYAIGLIKVHHIHEGGLSFKNLGSKKRRTIFFTSMNIYAKKHFGSVGRIVIKAISWWNSRVTNSDLSK